MERRTLFDAGAREAMVLSHPAAIVAAVALLAVLAAIGGYLIAGSSGSGPGDAQVGGAPSKVATGSQPPSGERQNRAFTTGRERGYEQAYVTAYRRAYAREFRKDGLAPPARIRVRASGAEGNGQG